MTAHETPPLAFERAQDSRRYRALLDGQEVAFAECDPIGADGLLIKHTEVLPSHEGRGIGGALVKHILDDAKSQGRGVIPICPYASGWIRRHPEYQGHVRP